VTVTATRWPADLKATSYVASILATRQAQAAGADTAVLCDGDELLETAEGNLLAIIDGVLVTPEADGRLLPGVTRELALEEAGRLDVPVRIGPLRRDDVVRAEAVIVSSAVAGLRTLATLDGCALMGAGADARTSADTLHPVVIALRQALEALRR
jgi:branched-subunit amino acid aminotransferase/4-amino-4-deoxychorismate lyase